ncbi:MAG: hypothetical protein MK008_10395 [Bdellovibrionales bacterium]|nr:hypothetical protein [Bdellovibrionales bacterium]
MKSMLVILLLLCSNLVLAKDCKSIFVDKAVQKEIEKKFLLYKDNKFYVSERFIEIFGDIHLIRKKIEDSGVLIHQGYLPPMAQSIAEHMLRDQIPFTPSEMRVRSKNGKKFLFTAKGEGHLERNEYEVEITKNQFDLLWGFTVGNRIIKRRLDIEVLGQTVTFDMYKDRDLIVAEVEFKSIKEAENYQALGKDVTSESHFKNKNLAKN